MANVRRWRLEKMVRSELAGSDLDPPEEVPVHLSDHLVPKTDVFPNRQRKLTHSQ